MKTSQKTLNRNIKEIRGYYFLLVEETKSHRLVGSTNEWVLDNYYVVSEQEKLLREELSSGLTRRIGKTQQRQIEEALLYFLRKSHYQIDKTLLMRFLAQAQVRSKDYLGYTEVRALPAMVKALLLDELAALCRRMKSEGLHHYSPTDRKESDIEYLNARAQDNLLMMNIWTSLKKVAKMPVSELIDRVSFCDRMLKAEKAGMYDQMYDRTKDDYRARIVRLARKRKMSEYELVQQMVARADEAGHHVGFELFPEKPYERRARIYTWGVVVVTLLLAGVLGWLLAESVAMAVVLAVLMVVPLSQVVMDVTGQILMRLHKPTGTFKLKFKDGIIPQQYATMVIMPTILKNKQKTVEMLEQLEVYYLSNINRGEGKVEGPAGHSQNLYYTLVGDAAAADSADMPWDDEVREAGLRKVQELNEKYGAPIFNFVYRKRAWSDGEGCYLGWERKRGAILHLNDLLLGNLGEAERERYFRCETISQWRTTAPDITFVITLDTDTELVLYSAQKLIGAMAHPLNRAQMPTDGGRVKRGYGIMQPRVNVDVEVTNKSRYAQLFSGLGGLDVYTTASFDLYQDIFGEGSFCGKGIYDLRVFQQVLKGRFPQNLILSHDLIEGCHIRCGLINDVELFDDSPSNYLDDAKRHHRWTRGDWQIIGWLGRKVPLENGHRVRNEVNTIGRWKIFDNLRRSVFSLALLVVLFVAYLLGATGHMTQGGVAGVLITTIVVIASPIVFFLYDKVRYLPRFERQYHYYTRLLRGIAVVFDKALISLALLPKEAWMYTDAIVRSCHRMLFSHKHLLAWIPSDEAARSTKGTLGDYARRFWFNYVCAAVLAVLTLTGFSFGVLTVASLLLALVWMFAPVLMYSIGRKFPQGKKLLGDAERQQVRALAEETWRYFDTLISPEHNYLVPDNYQLTRQQKADYKTSPTNIGYSLTAIVSACELGFITRDEAIERLEKVITTVERLEKWNGHLFNWYHIDTLKALPNFFISTCDSGNFVACLYVVRGFLPEGDPLRTRVQQLIAQTDFSRLYNPELDVFSIGFDHSAGTLLPYHYNNYASEARLTSFLTIAQGDVPYKHWFCLDKTLVQYKRYKGVASWYGTLFEYFMPLIFLPTFKHTLMDETYSFAVRAQRSFMGVDKGMPWGISETAYNELDDGQNYKYHAFGVPYLKFQNTTPDRIVVSPYSSIMTISQNDRLVYENIGRLKQLGMQGEMGLFESYDEEDHAVVHAHYAHHQGMILASLANYLQDNCLQRYFMSAPAMQSMETLLKEKAQVKPYIDLKITQYKRYQYSKEQTESDARVFDRISPVPEVGLLSVGEYTVMLDDRGSGYSRFRNVYLTRHRQVSDDHFGTYLFIRNLSTDKLWSSTYAPLDQAPERYTVSFASDKIEYHRSDNGIETHTEVTVVKDRLAELRRYTFTNNTNEDVDLELTSYVEVILAPHADDEAHRVFNAMRIDSRYDEANHMLVLSKGVEEGNQQARYFAMHKLFADPDQTDDKQTPRLDQTLEYETSRLNFLGRGGSLGQATVLGERRPLSGETGTTLDPIASMRLRLHVPAGKEASVFLLQGFGKAYEQLTAMAEAFTTALDVDNAFRSASVLSNMRHSMSLLKGVQMRLYNNILKYLLQTTSLSQGRNALLQRNTLSQSGLWRFGISGDLPILLLEIDSIDRSGYAKELLRAFEYFKVHGQVLDLVIINDEQGQNGEGLTHFIRNMAATEHLWQAHEDAGHVYVLNGSDLSEAERILLQVVARLTFSTRGGVRLEDQLARLEADGTYPVDQTAYPALRSLAEHRVWSSLDFYNQYGGFDQQGRDYVITNTNTPTPWVNVISNPHAFGTVVSSTMGGFTFSGNAQQFKLTAWSNDMVRDDASELLLVNGRRFVPATARHGQGFSSFDAQYDHFRLDARVFVSIDKPHKYCQLRLTNTTDQPLEVSLDLLCRFVLGQHEEQTARYLYHSWDAEGNTLHLRNVYHPIYGHTEVLLTATQPLTRLDLDAPNRKRVGLTLTLPPNGQNELAFVLSVGSNPQANIPAIDQEFRQAVHFWDTKLDTIQVHTPDPSFDYMLNRWYLYQVYTSRLYARAGFYQVGGATGYRDQLQDVMSLLYTEPDYARRQILDHAAHQFAEGDVLHWWHESLHLGARTTFSDDYLWLVYVTYQYLHTTGDTTLLSERVTFATGEPLPPDVPERGINYQSGRTVPPSDPDYDNAPTLFDHLRRAVDRARHRTGSHGLPLMGCGDWNDGMSRIGVGGKGESVWVAFFLVDLLPKMEEMTRLMPSADLTYVSTLTTYRNSLVQALQANAWDGEWFKRAYFDNGDPLGSRINTECQIDLISQAWSILTGVASSEQKRTIFQQADTRLVDRQHEIIRLLTPAFHHSANNPGYIMRYPVGVRENGGQYTHGAMWYIMAQLQEGRVDTAYYLYSIINPVHRTSSLADVLKYKVEPYCIAADIYSNPQHPGRGGWTWYTGSASWAYRTGIENILGLHLAGNQLTIDPRIPSEWEGFSVRYRYGQSTYNIQYHAGAAPRTIDLVDDGAEHTIQL